MIIVTKMSNKQYNEKRLAIIKACAMLSAFCYLISGVLWTIMSFHALQEKASNSKHIAAMCFFWSGFCSMCSGFAIASTLSMPLYITDKRQQQRQELQSEYV
jgi:formate-dependent nitrite reductase membrane component NrfD